MLTGLSLSGMGPTAGAGTVFGVRPGRDRDRLALEAHWTPWAPRTQRALWARREVRGSRRGSGAEARLAGWGRVVQGVGHDLGHIGGEGAERVDDAEAEAVVAAAAGRRRRRWRSGAARRWRLTFAGTGCGRARRSRRPAGRRSSCPGPIGSRRVLAPIRSEPGAARTVWRADQGAAPNIAVVGQRAHGEHAGFAGRVPDAR